MNVVIAGYDSPDLADATGNRSGADDRAMAAAAEAVCSMILWEFTSAISESGLPRAERQELIQRALDTAADRLGPAIDHEEGDLLHDCAYTAYACRCRKFKAVPFAYPEIEDIIEALARSPEEWAEDETHFRADD